MGLTPVTHFVGFRDDRYWNAVRARREIHPLDTVIFAYGDDTQKIARFNATDYREDEP